MKIIPLLLLLCLPLNTIACVLSQKALAALQQPIPKLSAENYQFECHLQQRLSPSLYRDSKDNSAIFISSNQGKINFIYDAAEAVLFKVFYHPSPKAVNPHALLTMSVFYSDQASKLQLISKSLLGAATDFSLRSRFLPPQGIINKRHQMITDLWIVLEDDELKKPYVIQNIHRESGFFIQAVH